MKKKLKLKKQKAEKRPAGNKEVAAQQYTDGGTIFEQDEFQQYPEVRDEKGIDAGPEKNKKDPL